MPEGEWKTEITPKTATLKIQDGEFVRFVFQDEGIKKISENFGTSIAFTAIKDGETELKILYVKANNFSLLAQIKELGVLKGLHVELSRKGKYKADTRYTIKKI